MKINELTEGVGRIVKGVNTTVDVGPNQTSIEAAKFGNKVDKDGRPPVMRKNIKGSDTNVLFNLGMAESSEPRYTAREWAIMEGGHTLEEPQPKKPGRIFTALENFADGKKKGKSRPGRVKRSGASCKGSVTDLRKRAKKYSGERGRMYHWCANMKGGKKK